MLPCTYVVTVHEADDANLMLGVLLFICHTRQVDNMNELEPAATIYRCQFGKVYTHCHHLLCATSTSGDDIQVGILPYLVPKLCQF